MKLFVLLTMLLLWVLPLMAETYTWVDEHGTVNFTEDFSSIPKKYRKKVNRRGDMGEQPVPASHTTDGADGKLSPPRQPRTTDGSAVPTEADSGVYDGKKAEVWQQEFRARGAELKRFEQQLIDLEALIRKPGGISKERSLGVAQEFKEAQRQYNDALKSYNELNDAANKAGVPAEFRK